MEFFFLLDRSGKGAIDFRTFLIGLAFISDTESRVDNGVDLLYHCFDPEGTGYITRKNVEEVLDRVFRKVDKATTSRLFRRVDPENTGNVDKETFKAFLDENPELLILGVNASLAFDMKEGQERKLTVLSGAEAEGRLAKKRAEEIV